MKEIKDLNDEAFEERLRSEFIPRSADWKVERRILESVLLKDEREVKRQRLAGYLRHAWIASIGLAATLVVTLIYFAGVDSGPVEEVDLPMVQAGTEVSTEAGKPILHLRSLGGSKQLIGVQDKGWVQADTDTVTREYSYEYIDTVDLVNEEDGSVIRMEIPRQEIVNVTYQVI
ncbi:MAG: hypothetical protein ABQ298_08990 [Puniceicoccaceae bacterium]